MQNNFEKNVQQKMDGLKLTPSAAVWEKVEMEIGAKKRKRRGIFWLLFAGLLLIGGGWWLHQSSDSKSQKAIAKNSNPTRTQSIAEAPIAIKSDTIENNKSIKTEKTSSPIKTSATKSATVFYKTRPVKVSSFVAKRKASFETQPSVVIMKASPNKKPETAAVVIPAKTDAASIKNENTRAIVTVDSTATQAISTLPPPLNSNDSTTIKKEEKEALPPSIDSITKNNDTALKKKVVSVSKWRKQITFGAGISGYAEGPFFQAFNSTRDAIYTSALSSPATPVAAAAQPSPVRSGIAFSLGFSLVKSISKRWELSIGLQYAYASTRQKVGDKKTVDTTVQFAMDKAATNGFYTNAGTTDYTARFHFVELPVSLSFKPLLHAPLYISLGAAYGRLLQTNALTFSSASNLYYQNKENYLRNALNISSSIQVDVLSKNGLSLCTGPFVQYNAIKLRKEASNGTPHLLVAGIKAAIIF